MYVTLVGSSDVLGSRAIGPKMRGRHGRLTGVRSHCRQRADDSTIHLVSALAGAERRLGDFKGADSLDWSPDGKWLAAGNSGQLDFRHMTLLPRPGGTGPRGIYLVSVEIGAPRPLIVSHSNRVDSKPAFSPDGQRLAYASCAASNGDPTGMRDCDVALVELDTTRATAQPPAALTTQRSRTSTRWHGRGTATPSSTMPSGRPFPACGA